MARSNAELMNHKKVKKALQKHDKRVNNEAKQAVRAGLFLIQNEAKVKAPVLTGNLVRSITNEVIETQREIDGRVGTETVYAPDVEFGTSNQRAQPYLRPAFDENKNRALKEIDEVLDELTRKWRR